MDSNSLTFRDHVIDGLRHDLTAGEHGLQGVPTAVKLVIRDEMWKERVLPKTGELITFAHFTDFVVALPPRGLGATVGLLKDICTKDNEALTLIDQVTKNPKHIHVSDGDNVTITEKGNSASQALRRLAKDRDDLHDRVLAGELSPHAAMVEAGFRPKTATVAVDDPDKVAAFLAKHFDAAEIKTIAEHAIALKEGRG